MIRNLLLVFAIAALPLQAAIEPLEQELDALAVPANQLPPAVSSESLYAVQTRYLPLRHRHEITIGGAKNFNADSSLTSQQLDLSYRFFFDDRWSVALSGSYVFNAFTDSANRLIEATQRVPDINYVKYRADLTAGFNLFYGKFRLTMDQVFYFDQYIALGPGFVNTNYGNTLAAVGDIGIAFWFGKSFSTRLGLKDYFFHEKRQMSSGMVHHLLAHADFGLVL